MWWWQFVRSCAPYKRYIGPGLMGLGIILLLLFVPAQVWLAIAGGLCVIAGAMISRG